MTVAEIFPVEQIILLGLLARVPRFGGQCKRIDIGIAVDTEGGLIVPVLRNVGERDAKDLRAGLDRMRADAAARSIPAEELPARSFAAASSDSRAAMRINAQFGRWAFDPCGGSFLRERSPWLQ